MKNTNVAKTIVVLALMALMQIAAFAQKAELVVQTLPDFSFGVAFSPDGKMFASITGIDKSVKLWDTDSGLLLKTYSGHTDFITTIAYSPDGKTLASGSLDATIKLWDAASGKELKTFSAGEGTYVRSVAFSPDGKMLASGHSNVFEVKLWDTASGKEIKNLSGHTSSLELVAFSPDGKTLASASDDGTIKLWDTISGRELKTLSSEQRVFSITFSPDGKTLASGILDGTVKLWDAASGREIKTLSGHTDLIRSVEFLPDGKTLASASDDKTIKLWDTASGKELKTLSGHKEFITSMEISTDGKTLVSVSDQIKFWDAVSGKEIETVSGRPPLEQLGTFSPDGKMLALVRSTDIKLRDTVSGQELETLSGHTALIAEIAFSTDGKMLASAGLDKTIKLWDTDSGRELKTIPIIQLTPQNYGVGAVAFSPDGKTLAFGSYYGTIKLWDVASGKLLKSFENKAPETVGEVSAVVPDFYKEDSSSMSSGGRFQLKPGESGKLNLFEAKTGKLLASLIELDKGDWVVIDPDGRFDASTGAQSSMHYVVGFEIVDLSQIKDRYFTPNLLQRILKGENLDQTRKVSIFTADELYPSVEYAPLKDGQTTVQVKLKNRGGGIGRVQIFVNGSEFLADARPKGFNPKSATGEFTVDFSSATTLKKGETNEISIVARNEAGWLKSRSGVLDFKDTRKKDDTPPEFYAIIGGVANYENSEFDLRYSAKDARDFAKAVELGAIKLFGKDKVHIRLLASGAEKADLTGADSTQMLPSKENFKQTFEEFRKAKTTDVFVVYLAGHGVSINKGGDTGDTYLFMTKEAVAMDKSRLLDDKLRDATTISSEELAEWIKEVPALKRAMILDTCAAGAIETSLTGARDMSPDQVKALDRMKDRTGFYVLMGSAADAQSYEATRYGQGLLTYSLLQGMSGAKLRDGEYADINSLFNYAEDTVTEMAKEIGGVQQPRIIAPTESRSFDIGRFSAQEKSKFTLAKVKPLILQPQFSNDKLKFDNLKISQSVAKALRDESSTLSRGGADAKIVFVEAEEMNDAITPGGVYEINGERIKVTLILVRNNEPLKTVVVEGTVADKEELSKKIVKAIIENAPN